MRIVGLVESPGHVCCRYRLAAFRPALEAAGHSLELVTLPRSVVGRLLLFRSLRTADLVILQRKLPSRVEVRMLRRWVPRLVFDFDDAVWLRDSYASKGFESPRRSRRFRVVAEACDLIVAGNRNLAAEAEKYARPGAVAVVPTCVAPTAYPLATHAETGPLRLVWVGSKSTLRGLERFRGTLEAIGKAVPDARLQLICDRFLTFENLRVECVPWAESTEAYEIAAADIGIGWVPDDPWSRGKCGLKILQYQAAGLPVVANPVGVQTDFVKDGETGYLATTIEEWVRAVQTLAADPKLRARLGAAGRAAVEERYSVAAGGRMWVNLLDRLAADVPAAGPAGGGR